MSEARTVLKPGALYWSDNGRVICVSCAGASALFSGRDLSGQKVTRVSAADVEAWNAEGDLGPLRCECRKTTLASSVVGPDGWPAATAPKRRAVGDES